MVDCFNVGISNTNDLHDKINVRYRYSRRKVDLEMDYLKPVLCRFKS